MKILVQLYTFLRACLFDIMLIMIFYIIPVGVIKYYFWNTICVTPFSNTWWHAYSFVFQHLTVIETESVIPYAFNRRYNAVLYMALDLKKHLPISIFDTNKYSWSCCRRILGFYFFQQIVLCGAPLCGVALMIEQEKRLVTVRHTHVVTASHYPLHVAFWLKRR